MTRSLSDPADRPHDETRAAALRDWNEAVARSLTPPAPSAAPVTEL